MQLKKKIQPQHRSLKRSLRLPFKGPVPQDPVLEPVRAQWVRKRITLFPLNIFIYYCIISLLVNIYIVYVLKIS